MWLSRLRIRLVSMWMQVQYPGLTQWVKDPPLLQAVQGCQFGLDPVLPWLRCRPTAAALIRALAWKLPYVTSEALKGKKKKGAYF